jgi:hypothetical protein
MTCAVSSSSLNLLCVNATYIGLHEGRKVRRNGRNKARMNSIPLTLMSYCNVRQIFLEFLHDIFALTLILLM